jgi:hypothetical protein
VKRGTSGTNAQCVLSVRQESKARPQARRNEHRKPSRSFMPTQPVAAALFVGSAGSRNASRASASAGLRGLFDDRAEVQADGREGAWARSGSRTEA